MEAMASSTTGPTAPPPAARMWAAVAAAGASTRSSSTRAARTSPTRLLELTAPRPGERVLELACGPGGPGSPRPRCVAPEGEVVALRRRARDDGDRRRPRARRAGLANVSARDARPRGRSTSPTRAYDVVLCREGLMLVPDPARAAREIRRVLRPGGRVGARASGARAQRNPWLGSSSTPSAPARRAGAAARDPGPFSLDDADRLAGVLRAAPGWPRSRSASSTCPTGPPRSTSGGSGRGRWPAAGAAACRAPRRGGRTTRAPAGRPRRSRRTRHPAGLELPGVCLVATARR